MSDPDKDARVVVIGAGQAGFEVCAKLRAQGWTGPITLVGEEAPPPYQRPPLSKAYLLGKMEVGRLFFRPAQWFEDENITLHLSTSCEAIDREAREVRLADGMTLVYDYLVLATGARPVRLPDAIGGGFEGVHYMRNLADADRLACAIAPGRRVLVVGGGYIGLEAAAVCAGLGLSVTLVESSDRILQRVASEQTSDFFRELHRQHGVEIRENTTLERLIEQDGRIVGAELSGGQTLEIDIAIVGIGVRPDQRLAEAAGLELNDGIAIDAQCRSSDPRIFAAGDCASFPYEGGCLRLESVGNAIDQAQIVAQVLCGHSAFYTPKPWFWSDQFETKLQIAGLSAGHDQVVLRKTNDTSMSFWYFRESCLIAIDAMNDPRAYMVAKRLIESGESPDRKEVSDTGTNVKELLVRAEPPGMEKPKA